MQITEDMIQQHLRELEVQKSALVDQINATMGAIQDCEYWIARLSQEPAKE